MRLRILTAGESHGPGLTVIVDGLPAGLPVELAALRRHLRRRQGGYGRGGRMAIERDEPVVTGGVRFGRTLGGPVAITIANRDWENWRDAMAVEGPAPRGSAARRVTRPRPGHADLAGALKFLTYDARDVLERASARETAARVAAGALCRLLLEPFGIAIASHVVGVGRVRVTAAAPWRRIAALGDDAPLGCVDPRAERRMMAAIDRARRVGDALGGVFEVVVRGAPPGLGTVAQSDRRLDARLAAAMMSVPAVKAVEIGEGIAGASASGSSYHDAIFYDRRRRSFVRKTNRAGGIEAGISNGEEIRLRGYLKPLSTLPRPLPTVDLRTKRAARAQVERTDASPIRAAGIVGEAVVAIVLADALLEKFGGDTLRDTKASWEAWRRALSRF